ncbi:MAG: ThiF family adenylyltransferase [Firmicutes bacterium]|nr:ThiF family adenylyltransferase [Alicyclobacillaceae bacterium]MCL6498193.1 ThiF family adenylyltransferase [Bacillota bacterium]
MTRVAVVGTGATGGAFAVGLVKEDPEVSLVLIDPDQVEWSNLPRAPWWTAQDVGQNKAQVLAGRLGSGRVTAVPAALLPERADELLGDADLVVDGTDNWEARRTMQAWAAARGRAWIYMSVLGLSGITALFRPGQDPCLFCLFGETIQQGPHCFEAGVLGTVALAVAGEALGRYAAWLRGDPGPFGLFLIDGLGGRTEVIRAETRCPHFAPLGSRA